MVYVDIANVIVHIVLLPLLLLLNNGICDYVVPFVGCWFWATISKTVRPMLSDSDRCLSCPVYLSVTLVYCGQTVAWINMKQLAWISGCSIIAIDAFLSNCSCCCCGSFIATKVRFTIKNTIKQGRSYANCMNFTSNTRRTIRVLIHSLNKHVFIIKKYPI